MKGILNTLKAIFLCLELLLCNLPVKAGRVQIEVIDQHVIPTKLTIAVSPNRKKFQFNDFTEYSLSIPSVYESEITDNSKLIHIETPGLACFRFLLFHDSEEKDVESTVLDSCDFSPKIRTLRYLKVKINSGKIELEPTYALPPVFGKEK